LGVLELVQFFILLHLSGADLEVVIPLEEDPLREARGVVRDINPLTEDLELLVRALTEVKDKTTEAQPSTVEVEEVLGIMGSLVPLGLLAVMGLVQASQECQLLEAVEAVEVVKMGVPLQVPRLERVGLVAEVVEPQELVAHPTLAVVA
jgi:hypothetical protein